MDSSQLCAGKMDLKCDKCPYSADTKGKLSNHRSRVHRELKPWICKFPGCGYQTYYHSALKIHGRSHETKLELRKPYPCTFKGCEYRAAIKATLDDHILAAHTPGRPRDFQCPLCPSRCHTRFLLQSHLSCHTKEKRFKCHLCKFQTAHKGSLPVHIRRMHEEPTNWSCSFPGCNYSATQQASVQVHRQTHDLDPQFRRRFLCSFPQCNYRGTTNALLKNHCRANHNPNRSPGLHCSLCSKTIFSKASLKSHIVFAHTREKHYSCSKCPYVTGFQSNFTKHCKNVHERTGPLEKRFKCDTCDYCSNRKHHRDLHVKTAHSGHREFQCDYPGCNYKTNNSYDFKTRHLPKHEEPEKRFPFCCNFPDCDYRWETKEGIDAHERCHGNPQNKFKCKLCLKVYPDRNSWYFHTHQIHRDKPCRSKLNKHIIDKVHIVTLQRVCFESFM